MAGILAPGLEHSLEVTVTEEMTASHVRLAGVGVLSTPAMMRLIELAAHAGAQPFLAPGQSTVGTRIELAHLAATPVGMRVRATVRLVEVDRRRLRFQAEVLDELEKVGEGWNDRFIVDLDRSDARLREKLARWRGGN